MGKIITDVSLKDVLEFSNLVHDRNFGSYDILLKQPFEKETPVQKMERFYTLVISDINKGVIPSAGYISHSSVLGFEGYGALPMSVLKDKDDQVNWLKNLLESYDARKDLKYNPESSPSRVFLLLYSTPTPLFGETLTFCTDPKLYKNSNVPRVHFYNNPETSDDQRTLENVREALRPLLKESILEKVAAQIHKESGNAVSPPVTAPALDYQI